MAYPGSPAETVTYAYLPQLSLNSVTGDNNYVTASNYDEAGRMISRNLANGKMQTFTYYGWTETSGDNAKGGLLKSIQVNGLQNLSYQYDAGGNITKITDAIAVQDQTFTYDSINRLTSAQATGSTGGGDGGYNETYGYDSATGNLNSKAGNNYTYGDSAHPHAATQMGSNSYSYDSNGNMTTRTSSGSTYSLGYDAEGRMTSVSGATTAAFVYDGDGNRVKSTIGTQTVAYIGPRVEYNITTNTMTRYYLFGSERIAMRVLDKWKTPNETNTIYYTLSDHLGSASIMTDTSGNRKTEYRYKAWGEDRYTYFASGTVQTAYQYTGQRNDPGMGGLLFYNARWYDSYLNQWAQPDSIIPDPSNPQDWDRYSYVRNSPINYNDPNGHGPVVQQNGQSAAQIIESDYFALAFLGIIVVQDQYLPFSIAEIQAFEGAAKDTANKLSETVGMSPIDAFRSVYNGGFSIKRCQKDQCSGFGWVTDANTLYIRKVYTNPEVAKRHIVHEFGHLLDQRYPLNPTFWDLRKSLAHEVPEYEFPGRTEGFAGGLDDWQFNQADNSWEEFADMYVGWVYDRWATKAQERWGGNVRSSYMERYMFQWLAVSNMENMR